MHGSFIIASVFLDIYLGLGAGGGGGGGGGGSTCVVGKSNGYI